MISFECAGIFVVGELIFSVEADDKVEAVGSCRFSQQAKIFPNH